MSTTQNHVTRYRRIALAVALAGIALLLCTLFVGGTIPAAIMVPVNGIVLVALLLWVLQYKADQSQARRNDAEGRSWRPGTDQR
jgi:uncharacterized membrane protein